MSRAKKTPIPCTECDGTGKGSAPWRPFPGGPVCGSVCAVCGGSGISPYAKKTTRTR